MPPNPAVMQDPVLNQKVDDRIEDILALWDEPIRRANAEEACRDFDEAIAAGWHLESPEISPPNSPSPSEHSDEEDNLEGSDSNDTDSPATSISSTPRSMVGALHPPQGEPDARYPDKEVVIFHALSRLAFRYTWANFEPLFNKLEIDDDFPNYDGLVKTLKWIAMCSCADEERKRERCFTCGINICKDCGYCILQFCRPLPNDLSSALPPRSESVLTRRLVSHCSRPGCKEGPVMRDPAQNMYTKCMCTAEIVDKHHRETCETGDFCKSCVTDVMKHLVTPNTRLTENTVGEDLHAYICSCGLDANPDRPPLCRMCRKLCLPVRVNEPPRPEDFAYRDVNKSKWGYEGHGPTLQSRDEEGVITAGNGGWNNNRGCYYIPAEPMGELLTVADWKAELEYVLSGERDRKQDVLSILNENGGLGASE